MEKCQKQNLKKTVTHLHLLCLFRLLHHSSYSLLAAIMWPCTACTGQKILHIAVLGFLFQLLSNLVMLIITVLAMAVATTSCLDLLQNTSSNIIVLSSFFECRRVTAED